MKKIKKEIEVVACELCGKELKKEVRPFTIKTDLSESAIEDGTYYFHLECVEKMLLKIVKDED